MPDSCIPGRKAVEWAALLQAADIGILSPRCEQ